MQKTQPSSNLIQNSNFTVDLPTFCGSLTELAALLRGGGLEPSAVPLLQLTRAVLAWAEQITGQQPAKLANTHPDLLPSLAAVIALKAKLLLPVPEETDSYPDEDDWEYSEGDPTTTGVEMLAELESLVSFLAERRKTRQNVIAVRGETPKLPRRQRKPNPNGSLSRLFAAAQQAVRQVDVPLLARERLSLSDALAALRAFGQRLGHFCFGNVTVNDWGERTTYFAALLEGIKQGDFVAEQGEQFGEIAISTTNPRQD